MKVFDISDWNPDDRVHVLAQDYGADGIIIKLGETRNGIPALTEKFSMFVNDAIEEGLPYGVYYYSHAHNMDDFLEEAEWMNDALFDLLGGTFPPLGIWWDLEDPAVKRPDVWEQIRDTIGTQQTWYEANKWKIGIYAGYSYFNEFLPFEELTCYQIPIWVAQYRYHENSLKEEHDDLNHVAWQYSETYDGMSQDVSEWYGFKELP